MKLFSLIFLLHVCLIPLSIYSQSHFVVNGKVENKKTLQPLPYANVSITNAPIGTLTNELGEFEFHIPENYLNDTLVISYIGYGTHKQSIAHLLQNKIQEYLLEEIPTLLDEVVVAEDTGKKIVEDALQAIPVVYNTQPYLLEGFHRSWEKIEFTDSITYPGTLIEAAVRVYDPGYPWHDRKNKSKEEIYIRHVRRSFIMPGWNYDGNALEWLLKGNLVRHPGEKILSVPGLTHFPNNHTYHWEKNTFMDGETLHVVNVEIPDFKKFPVHYRVYISDTDRAILKFELMGGQRTVDYTHEEWHMDTIHAVFIFKRFRQKPYLTYAKIEYTIKKLDLHREKVIRKEDYLREFMVSTVVTDDVGNFRKTLKQRAKSTSLALQAKTYDEEFWKHYNIMKETPLDIEILKFFEENAKLESQFKSKKKAESQ